MKKKTKNNEVGSKLVKHKNKCLLCSQTNQEKLNCETKMRKTNLVDEKEGQSISNEMVEKPKSEE